LECFRIYYIEYFWKHQNHRPDSLSSLEIMDKEKSVL
jgi:hypothetical protein